MPIFLNQNEPSPSAVVQGDTQVTINYTGRIYVATDNPVKMELSINNDPHVTIVSAGVESSSTCWNEPFPLAAIQSFTKTLTIRVKNLTDNSPVICELILKAYDKTGKAFISVANIIYTIS